MTSPLRWRTSGTARLNWALLFFLLFPAAASSPAKAQVTEDDVTVEYPDAIAEQPLTVRAELHRGEQIARVYFLYRVFSRSDYTVLQMDLVGNTGTVQIPARDVLTPFLEYYLVLATRSGEFQTYPPGESADPFTVPPAATRRITVSQAGPPSGIAFLSPEPNARLTPEDLLISISLFREDTLVVKQATQILLDQTDISSSAVLSGDILVVVPANTGIQIASGMHTITVRMFRRDGTFHGSASLHFMMITPGMEAQPFSPEPTFHASTQLESRHEGVGGTGTWYNRASVLLNGGWDEWTVTSNLFVTSDEASNLQPQNRYFAGVESPWLKAGYGDNYPVFPSLLMSGKRIRGFTGKLLLGPQAFIVAAGETDRGIEGSRISVFPVDSLAIEQQRDPGAAYAPIDGTNGTMWGKFDYGTFKRNILVLRSETKPGKTWDFGITALKGKDDTGSIQFGTRPQENIVLGVDLNSSFDDRHIEFAGQAAFSAFNSDISSGPFTDEYIDTTYASKASDIKNVRDLLDQFITVNDNLRPLSLKQLSTLAYELSLGVRYLNNMFKATYLFHGSDYTSFGQTFLRKDVQGITALDRIGLALNQIQVSLGFEHLQDNTSHSKAATTTFLNYDAALSYLPSKRVPNITVGFGLYTSDNGLSTTGQDSLSSIDEETDRFFLQTSHSVDWGTIHTTSLTFSGSKRDDRSVRGSDVNNTSVALSVTSRYKIPLQTGFDLTFSFNTFPSAANNAAQQLDYTTLSLSGQYRVWRERLSLEARVSPTIGDVERTVWDASASCEIIPNMTAQIRFSYFNNKGLVNDNIWALTYRYGL